jgi:6-phosphofructokinase 1
MLFSGGPAPAANAVISTAAASFHRSGIQVIGIMYGYSQLVTFSPQNPLQEGRDYIQLDPKQIRRTRNSRGIMIGTARENPGRLISSPSHVSDPERSGPMRTVYEALDSIGIDALISIGGDDTLKTANKFKLFQDSLPADRKRMPVVHLPKTIDNDYMGIDFTFGYFTAAEFLANEVRNMLADAEAARSYFIAETMGRSAGWLAYGAAIAGEASLVLSVEDITGKLAMEETAVDEKSGEKKTRKVMNLEEVVNRIVRTILVREQKEGKEYGVIILAEGLAEYLSNEKLEGIPRDPHGHIAVSELNLSRLFAERVSKKYKELTGRRRKVTGVQLGYESRCALPHAFDVMLGSQLGVGSYRALIEEGLNGVMVSTTGQFQLSFVPFETLVDPQTLTTIVRYVEVDSDFHKLARFLETNVNE